MKIKAKLYVDKPHFGDELQLWMSESTCDTCLGSVEVEVDFEVPSDIDVRNLRVAKLRQMIEKERAGSQVKVESMEGAIQKLMALGADDE